ncbi:hypothetical protein M231_07181 [Tremella mesenterica]|uniref:Uncharacterized protein n=1 Tax=Tremella mesenterica TaxID=5217 RepID=A0A4Q1B9U7_TREME|nr:hypothetical protein M231_07181 [Tremella mesenterica]
MTTTYNPKYPQPFTLAEAIELDVSTILAEISRLRNSLHHLEDSQRQLKDFLLVEDEGSEGEMRRAIVDNEVTIATQQERIILLRLALQNKVGEEALKHYGLEVVSPPDLETTTPTVPPVNPPAHTTPLPPPQHETRTVSNGQEGMYL